MTFFTHERPRPWAYAIWFLFLVGWMQGMAVLNIVWPVALLVGLRHLPYAIRQLQLAPWLWKAWLLYEGLRIVSTLFADHPEQAMLGLFDDFRAITCALLALAFIRDKSDLIRAGWATFAGFTLLAWWSLAYQLFTYHDLLPHHAKVIFGTLAHMNYSAAWSMCAMLAMLVVLIRHPLRRSWPMLLGIIPIAMMQVALQSRTVMLVAAAGLLVYIIWQRSWRILMLSSTAAGILVAGLALSPGGLSQFGHLNQYEDQLHGKASMPSLQIRLEIWHLIGHLVADRPIGLGPRNHGYVDLNAERAWIADNMPFVLSFVYHLKPGTPEFEQHDFNQSRNGPYPICYDPHSQYTATLAEIGWPGVAALLLLWGGFIVLAIRNIRLGSPATRTLGEVSLAVLWMYLFAGITIPLMYQAGGIIFFSLACTMVASLAMHREEQASAA
jgi:hypothetical protein